MDYIQEKFRTTESSSTYQPPSKTKCHSVSSNHQGGKEEYWILQHQWCQQRGAVGYHNDLWAILFRWVGHQGGKEDYWGRGGLWWHFDWQHFFWRIRLFWILHRQWCQRGGAVGYQNNLWALLLGWVHQLGAGRNPERFLGRVDTDPTGSTLPIFSPGWRWLRCRGKTSLTLWWPATTWHNGRWWTNLFGKKNTLYFVQEQGELRAADGAEMLATIATVLALARSKTCLW